MIKDLGSECDKYWHLEYIFIVCRMSEKEFFLQVTKENASCSKE